MYKEKNEVAGFSGQLDYVDTCPNQPESVKAFCAFHCHEAMKNEIPTDLQRFKVSHLPCKWRIMPSLVTILILFQPIHINKTYSQTQSWMWWSCISCRLLRNFRYDQEVPTIVCWLRNIPPGPCATRRRVVKTDSAVDSLTLFCGPWWWPHWFMATTLSSSIHYSYSYYYL